MRVVVTGATGNVGSGVLRALVDDPDVEEIVGVARRIPPISIPKVSWVAADVSSDDLDVFVGADAVIHLAWLIQPVRDVALLRRVNVEGTRRVLAAVRRHRVGTFVVASSVGAYSYGPKRAPVDESWPARGIRSSVYSRQKADVEQILTEATLTPGGPRIVLMRTSLVFSERAASGIAKLFLGPLVPIGPIGHRWLPIVPKHPRLVFQATHTDDIGRAYRATLHADLEGPVNVAASPVIDGDVLADLFEARAVSTPAWVLRRGAAFTHALRLQRTSSGWVDLALGVPTMATGLAEERLGWVPTRSSIETFASLLDGFAGRAGAETAPLAPRSNGVVLPFLSDSDSTSRPQEAS